jgi:hypothetical protein
MASHVATVRVIREATGTRTTLRVTAATRTGLRKVRGKALATTQIQTLLVPLQVLRLVITRTAPPQDKVAAPTRDRAATVTVRDQEVVMTKSGEVIAATYLPSRKYRPTFALPMPG